MAHANELLVNALRTTAQRLREGAPYAWGHHGQCNCGNLAQVVTTWTAGEIMRFAHAGSGEWTELANDYCGISEAPAEMLVHRLMDVGLTPSDIHHLEYLSDKAVLQHLEGGFRWLKRNRREDAIAYFEAFATLLEGQLIRQQIVNEMNALQTQPEMVLETAGV
jgi:hypothetical protein